ncbi:WG repeat-containing protein [uncultured Aquimarina sp.]|uniref:WG repeat-containing protein n=1 Tax=uncultured Aquimarina sp. TaxID=575652 RepID=UPI00260A4C3D|nr:WG repeat-containing protein [uncultured Aquimarina sp.]
MKNVFILFVCLIVFPNLSVGQIIENIDKITPFHEEFAAVRKGNTWAFINTNGEIVIGYRDDLVWSTDVDPKSKKKNLYKEPISYPAFYEGRCLIKQMINGIYYYGYIDKTGKTIIEPEYINATPFEKGYAIVLKVSKEELGKNDLLHKKVVSYSYDEVVIDPLGNIKMHLQGPEHLVLTKEKMKWRPVIESYLVSPGLAAVKTKSNGWKLKPMSTSD